MRRGITGSVGSHGRRRAQSRLQARIHADKVFMGEELTHNGLREQVSPHGTLGTVRGHGRHLAVHIGRDVDTGRGRHALCAGLTRMYGEAGLLPPASKRCGLPRR